MTKDCSSCRNIGNEHKRTLLDALPSRYIWYFGAGLVDKRWPELSWAYQHSDYPLPKVPWEHSQECVHSNMS